MLFYRPCVRSTVSCWLDRLTAGSFDELSGKVIRIGHMGSNANVVDMIETLDALDDTLRELNVPLKGQLRMIFQEEVSQKGLVL